jgi:hypothetical protein
LLYTGAITITNTVQVRARAFSSGRITSLDLRTPNRTSHDRRHHEFLLVLTATRGDSHIVGGSPAPDNSVIVACFDNDGGRSSLNRRPQLIKRAGINVRGLSTQIIPKQSYACEFWNEFNDDDAVSMLGLPEESDWVLYAQILSIASDCTIH